MTTPGHQARQNAADDGLPPDTDFPPGDSVPAEEDSGYPPADDPPADDGLAADGYSGYPPAGGWYPSQQPPTEQYPYRQPPAEEYVSRDPGAERYPRDGQNPDDGRYAGQRPPAEQYPGYAGYLPAEPGDAGDGTRRREGWDDGYGGPTDRLQRGGYPGDHQPDREYRGRRRRHAADPGPPQPPAAPAWPPGQTRDPGPAQGPEAAWSQPAPPEPGAAWPPPGAPEPAAWPPQAPDSDATQALWAQRAPRPPDQGWADQGWAARAPQPPEAGWARSPAQPLDPGWAPRAPQPPETARPSRTRQPPESGWYGGGAGTRDPRPADETNWTVTLNPQAGWPVDNWDPPTVRLPVIAPEEPGETAPGPTGASVLRSSSTMALGTVVSRITGFIRTAILVYALGTQLLGDAYNISNTLPNVVYQFALGGIFTSVIVPLLVNAARRHSDRGQAYDQRIFTLGVLALGGVTLIATVAAAPITAIYAHGIGNASAYRITVILAYFFIPQIFFYGVSSLAGAILNARGSFASPMWTPVINNVVVIVVGLMFMATVSSADTTNQGLSHLSGGDVALLGIGTTLGIVLQTVAMIPSLRRVGFRWRPRYDFRRAELSEIGRMSGWMFGYVLATQIGFLVTTLVANSAGARAAHGHASAGAGFAAYSYAYTLFQLPYAIIGISVITAMLPRMSSHAAEGRYRQVAADFSTATRLASVIVAPAALILAVLGAPLAEGLLGYGSTSAASARYVGEIFAVFSLGLLPYMLFQLLLRVFYAMHDSRTPALIGLVTMSVNILANLIALATLPPQHVVAGLGAGFGVANLIGTAIAWRVIGRRIGGLDGPVIRASLVRMHAAAIPGALFAIAVLVMVNAVIPGGRLGALFTVAVGGGGALLLYVTFAKAIGIPELSDLISTVRARLR